jgi:hypothetical protein
MIFRLIESRIISNALPQHHRVHQHIREGAVEISTIDW